MTDHTFDLDNSNEPKKRIGAVILFNSEADMERVQQYLDRIAERGIIDPTSAHEFDERYGTPVWYIP